MRQAITALLLLAAAPAAAQDLDTTRYEVKDNVGGATTCRFKAIPELTLRTSTGLWTGRWEAPAIETPDSSVSLYLLYTAILDRNRNKDARLTIGQAYFARAPLGTRSAVSARITFDDGGPELATIPLREQGDRYMMNLRTVLPRFETSKLATLVLLDAMGKAVATYSWDVSTTRTVFPLLNAVEWRCRKPMI